MNGEWLEKALGLLAYEAALTRDSFKKEVLNAAYEELDDAYKEKPRKDEYGFTCPGCGGYVGYRDICCHHCGKSLEWDGITDISVSDKLSIIRQILKSEMPDEQMLHEIAEVVR